MLATPSRKRARVRVLAPSLAAALLIGTMSSALHAQTTPRAGDTIGNRASATYSDGSGIQRSVTSNEVVTTVDQVAAVSLAADRSEVAAPGSPVVFAHTVTNTGNGNDTFALTAVIASGALNNIRIFADVNGDGVPDSTTPITITPSLAPGESFNFVVVAEVPGNAASDSTSSLTVTATSTTPDIANEGTSASNTDTVTVSPNAIINLTKAIDQSSGPASGRRTYTLTYTNSGSTTSGPLTITDILPDNVDYVEGSARWSNSGSAPLTDDDEAETASGITYTNDGDTLTAVITAGVPRGDTGRITFQVDIESDAPRGNIVNFATASYSDGGTPSTTRSDRSNNAIYTVNPSSNVTFVGPAEPVESADPGQSISFNNLLTNNGNGPDSFDIVVNTPGSFPAGTTFELFKTDGVTPLTDTNGNTIPDTGTLSVGGEYTVVLRVNLPTTSPATPNGPYNITKTATSFLDPTVEATATDTLDTIAPTTVDLTNVTPDGTFGEDAGPEASPVLTVNGNPGTTVRIPLTVSNEGGAPDSYAFSSGRNSTLSQPTNSNLSQPLPPGYTVIFRDAATNAVVTNTSVIAAGDSRDFIAEVFIPAGTPAGVQDVFFRVFSPTSNTGDTIHDAIRVNAVDAISVEPDQSGQIYQGGSIVYQHTITNNGNAPLTGVTVGTTNTQDGFTSVVYRDTNGNGVLEPSEVAAGPLTSIGDIPSGGTVSVIVQVFAPLGATPSTTNATAVTVSGTTGSVDTNGNPIVVTDTATDTTRVVVGSLSIEKFQSLDNQTFTKANLSAAPGSLIYYRIEVRNTGVTSVNNVVINDQTPNSTTYDDGDGNPTPGNAAAFTKNGGSSYSAGSAPESGQAGAVTFNVGDLAPGETATATFRVVIDGPSAP